MSDQLMTELFKQGKRQHVIECLARDEFPYANWQHEFPDLAAERLIEVQDTSELYAMRTQALMLRNTAQVDLINAELKTAAPRESETTMSEYVALIEVPINPHHNDGLTAHAITICGNPQAALAGVHAAWPWSNATLVHSVRSENRSEMLFNAVRIKLASCHFKFNWYRLTPDALAWFKAITDENYVELIHLVENQSAEDNGGQVRDVTRRKATGRKPQPKPEVPEMTPEEVDTLRQQLLASIG